MLFIGATSSSVANTCRIALLWPMMLSKRKRSCSCARSSAFSARSRRWSIPALQHARELRQLERLDQEVDRAALDRRDRFLDAAEPGDDDAEDAGIAIERRVEDVHAVGVGQPQIDDQRVVGESVADG